MFFPDGNHNLVIHPPEPSFYVQKEKSDNIPKLIVPNETNPAIADSEPLDKEENMCYQHYKGKCNAECKLLHYLRLPKRTDVCQFYANRAYCGKNDACLYMHSNFPCTFHYLDLAHPPEYQSNCRFLHGKSIDRQLGQKLIEEALRLKLFNSDVDLIEEKFAKRNAELADYESSSSDEPSDVNQPTDEINYKANDIKEQQNINKIVRGEEEAQLPNELLQLYPILTKAQLQYLLKNNIASLSQIIAMSISQQRAHNLEIDQIYELHLAALKSGTLKDISLPVQENKTGTRIDDENNSNEAEFLGFEPNEDNNPNKENVVASSQPHQISLNFKIDTNGMSVY